MLQWYHLISFSSLPVTGWLFTETEGNNLRTWNLQYLPGDNYLDIQYSPFSVSSWTNISFTNLSLYNKPIMVKWNDYKCSTRRYSSTVCKYLWKWDPPGKSVFKIPFLAINEPYPENNNMNVHCLLLCYTIKWLFWDLQIHYKKDRNWWKNEYIIKQGLLAQKHFEIQKLISKLLFFSTCSIGQRYQKGDIFRICLHTSIRGIPKLYSLRTNHPRSSCKTIIENLTKFDTYYSL